VTVAEAEAAEDEPTMKRQKTSDNKGNDGTNNQCSIAPPLWTIDEAIDIGLGRNIKHPDPNASSGASGGSGAGPDGAKVDDAPSPGQQADHQTAVPCNDNAVDAVHGDTQIDGDDNLAAGAAAAAAAAAAASAAVAKVADEDEDDTSQNQQRSSVDSEAIEVAAVAETVLKPAAEQESASAVPPPAAPPLQKDAVAPAGTVGPAISSTAVRPAAATAAVKAAAASAAPAAAAASSSARPGPGAHSSRQAARFTMLHGGYVTVCRIACCSHESCSPEVVHQQSILQ
jgi:hypothetical protein